VEDFMFSVVQVELGGGRAWPCVVVFTSCSWLRFAQSNQW